MMTAQEIKETRKSLALTQEEFAKALNVSIVTVGYWEIGERTPNSTSVKKIKILEEQNFKNTITLEEIENLRIQANLSQEQLAKLMKIKQQTYSTWLTGKSNPSPKSVRKLIEIKEKLIQKIENN